MSEAYSLNSRAHSMASQQDNLSHAYRSAGVPIVRSLTTSLDRLRGIAETIEGANERSGRFLDTLVGAELQKGEGTLTAGQIEVNSFISELHRLIDRVERAASVADTRAFRLLAAADDGIAEGSVAKVGTFG